MGLFGNEAEDVTKRLIDYADITSRMNGIDGETIGITQTKLLTFRELAKSADVAGGAFDRATMAALDMASAGFGTAEMNAVQLGKALNDPIKGINSLTRSGITFTAQEKAKIKTLVETNQTLKAQDLILSAIETQVGGTAAATATASGKMKASMAQLVDAFAEPFSEGFNSIPGALENVFPKLAAKAEEMGQMLGLAISDAVAGDYERFVRIGELIGTAVKEGIKVSASAISGEIGQAVVDYTQNQKYNPVGAIYRKMNASELHRLGNQQSNRQNMRGALSNVSEKYSALQGMGKRGVVPGSPEFRYAQPNEPATMMDGERVVRILESIDRRLSPQPQ
jgi:hypothetical protein